MVVVIGQRRRFEDALLPAQQYALAENGEAAQLRGGDGGPALAQRPDMLDGLQADARLVEHQCPRNHRFIRSQREGGV